MSEHTERSILDRLAIRYGVTYKNGAYVGRRYARAEHVHITTGFATKGKHRIADFIAIDANAAPHDALTAAERNLDPSVRAEARQGAIHGHEVKVSRADWLSELANPEKAEAWRRYCTYWWLVAPREVVHDDLPDGWGLMIPHGRSLRVVVGASRRVPDPMPVRTVAALARAIGKTEAGASWLGGGQT